jgi:hypothetical protein
VTRNDIGIERCWDIVASIAWKEYTTYGRGALLFTQSVESGDDWDCVYLPMVEFEGVPLMREYCDLMKEYDPTEQLVAVFLTAPDCVSAYCGSLTPNVSRLRRPSKDLDTH